MQGLDLASGFAPGTQDDWRELVDKALKGAPFDGLRHATDDGFLIEPLYAGRRDQTAEAGRKAALPWTIVTRILHPDPAEANRLILDDLNGGAGGIDLIMASSNHARGAGLVIGTLDDLERLLDGVYLDLVSIRVNAGHECRPLIAMVLALAEKRGIAASALDIRAAVDPVGSMARTGWMPAPLEMITPRMRDALHYAEENGLGGSLMMADGRVWHAAGASDAQELGYTLATAVAYLRMLDDPRIADLAPQDRVEVVLAADADQFATIAKFRAMRRLWARVLDASGLEQRPLHIHAETAWRMMTRRDPWVNMLRGTVAAFAAGVGGADSVTVLPFTEVLGLPDGFARRIARNTQTILLEESNLHRVADPAAGSGAVEARTDELVRKAWALFCDVERQGGIERAYKGGEIAPRIAEVRAARMRRVATRLEPLTGTSAFANLNEKVVAMSSPPCSPDIGVSLRALDLPDPGKGELMGALIAAVQDGATLTDMTAARYLPPPVKVEELRARRLAEPFEALRDAADRGLEETGERPCVFLATIGGPADYTARAGWARNLFAAGGIEAVGRDDSGLDDAFEVTVAAFAASNARVACLCSSDALYAEHAVDLVLTLKDAGAHAVYLAGRPGEQADALKGAGVAGFLYEGCDVVAVLRHAHDVLDLV